MQGGGNFGDSIIGSMMGLELSKAKQKNEKYDKTIRNLSSQVEEQAAEIQRLQNTLKQRMQEFQTTISGLREQVQSLQQISRLKERSQIALHVRMIMHRENLAKEMTLKESAVRLVSSKTGADVEVVENWIEEITDPAQVQRIIDRFEEEDRRIDPYIPTTKQRDEMIDQNMKWAGSEMFKWVSETDPDYIERRKNAKNKRPGP